MQKPMNMLLLLLTVCLTLNGLAAQNLAATNTPLSEVEELQLPTLDNKELLRAEEARRAPGIAPRFAETIEVNVSPSTHGTWEVNNGRAIWRLRVPSPGAKSLNFGFDRYRMPEGGQLMLYTPDGSQVQGPFTPADNEEHEELWTPAIPGDELVIEVSVPEARQGELRLHLKSVNHDFLGFGDIASGILSGSCNLDVVCGAADGWGIVDQYRDIIQSVAVIGLNGGTFCTGFLVSNTRQDCAPFFMTANHCGINNGNASSLVVYWNFINSVCRQPNTAPSGGNGDGSLADFNTGSIFRAAYAPSDMTLVELDDPVSATADAWFAGWNAREDLEQDTIIGVHHPSTDEKRISFEFDGTYVGEWGAGNTSIPDGDHLIIADWDIGTTEGGSSGSPIFNSDKQVIGQLHGGAAACGNDAYDSYGWFFTSWEGGGTPSTRLRDWLDPDNTGLLEIPGRAQMQCSFFAEATPAVQTLCAPSTATYDISVSENFAGPVDLVLTGLPAGLTAVFDQTTVNPGEGTQMTISGTENLAEGTYNFGLFGTDGANESNQNLILTVLAGAPAAATLLSPEDMAMDQFTGLQLSWEDQPLTSTYDIEIATDPGFTNIIGMGMNLENSNFQTPTLDILTTYYWRVRSTNICGTGDWSEAFQFETAALSCSIAPAATEGVTIGPGGGTVTTSALMIDQPGEILDVSLTNLSTNHTWMGDLNATLTSPEGTVINLFNRPGCNQEGMLVNFSDDAAATSVDFENTCDGGGVAISGDFQPAEPFSNFMNEEATGPWTLTIIDNANQDGGDLLGWNLEICTLIPSEVIVTTSVDEVSVCNGDFAVVDVTVGTGFTSDVTLSAENLPAGATADFEMNPITPGSTVSVTLNNLTVSGNYNISIQGTDGSEMASTMLTLEVLGVPAVPNLTAPADLATDVDLSAFLQWTPQGNANDYLLTLSTNPDLSDPVLIFPAVNPTVAPGVLEYNTTYYWQVIANNDCGGSDPSPIFSFTTAPDVTVTATQPTLVSCLTDETVAVFTLGEGLGGEHQVSISATPAADFSGFSQNFEPDTRELSLSWDNFLGIAPGSYILSVTITGEGYSNVGQLMVTVASAPALSNLLLPVNTAELNAGELVEFSWEAIDGVSGYLVEVATDDGFTDIVLTGNVTDTQLSSSLPIGQYYWRVTTINDCGESISGFFIFTVMESDAVVELAGTVLEIWPNPTTGPLQISLTGELNEDLIVNILTVHGQQLLTERLIARAGVQELDLSNLPAGAYLVRLSSGTAQQTVRILVQK